MESIRLEEFGSPSTLKLREIELAGLEPDEVRVEVFAAAVNPSDVKNVQGAMAQTTLPRTPGRDLALHHPAPQGTRIHALVTANRIRP